MLHALLPAAPNENKAAVRDSRPTKFVDQGTPLLIQSVLALGAKRGRLQARLCGGARVLSAPGFQDSLNIGDRNIHAAEAALEAAGIQIQARDIGGKIGRTVKLHIGDGQVTVRSLGQGERTLPE
jgi:chemotaxis protein CheD